MSHLKCSNCHWISKLLLNFGCLSTFCYLDGANSIKTYLHICNLYTRVATAAKAAKDWSLPRFWVSIHSYKKQPVKKIWGRILDLAWLKFTMVALVSKFDLGLLNAYKLMSFNRNKDCRILEGNKWILCNQRWITL